VVGSRAVVLGSEAFAGSAEHPVVCIGNFDGVHRGHRALLARVVELARTAGAPAVAYTFDPLPAEVLAPERASLRLQTTEERVAALLSAGIDTVVIERFDREFASHNPEWFVRTVVQRRLGASQVVVGWNFRFGSGRAGSVEDLARWSAVAVEPFGPFHVGEEVVSSSRIREAVLAGDVERASRLLGRPFRIAGTVVSGDGRARTLGFPTANLYLSSPLLPAPGVYAVRVPRYGTSLLGVMNIGIRPTFQAGFSVEVHLLDAAMDLYGEVLHVECVARIRAERRFDGVQSLVEQIRSDIAEARVLLAES
jgi:riboflavin kinase/FMN adenylyltransferase